MNSAEAVAVRTKENRSSEPASNVDWRLVSESTAMASKVRQLNHIHDLGREIMLS